MKTDISQHVIDSDVRDLERHQLVEAAQFLVETCHQLRLEEEGLSQDQPLQVGTLLVKYLVYLRHQRLVSDHATIGEVETFEVRPKQGGQDPANPLFPLLLVAALSLELSTELCPELLTELLLNSILQVGVGDAVAPVNNWTRKKLSGSGWTSYGTRLTCCYAKKVAVSDLDLPWIHAMEMSQLIF